MKKELIYLAGTDFSHLTSDELIKGIKALDLPEYIRSKAYGIDVRETLAQMTEMTIQLGVNMGLSPDDALKWARKLQESVSQSEFDSWVATLLDGGPSIFMNTLSELQSTYPNGASGVALVRETDPAKIYVWNGSAWEDFGDYQGIEVADSSITSSKIADGAITPEKTGFFINGKNMFDKNATVLNRYANYLTGAITPLSNYRISDFIPVIPGQVITKTDGQQGAFYSDKGIQYATTNYISGFNNLTTITVPTGANYMVTTVKEEDVDRYQVELGDTLTDYEPFGKKLPLSVFSKESLDEIGANDLKLNPSLLLPKNIQVVVNEKFNLFLDGIIKYYQEFKHGNYYISVQEKKADGSYGIKGTLFNYKWEYLPTAVENFNLEVRVVENYTEKTVHSQIINFNVSSVKTAKTATNVTIGDSFTDGWFVSKKLSDMLETDGNNINFIGLHETGKDGVFDDAWSGYSWEWYNNGATGYKRDDRADGDATSTPNQFYNPATSKFDFSYYMSTYQNNVAVDSVVINLGLNDVQTKTISQVVSNMTARRNDVSNIISSIKAYNPNIKILVGLIPKQVEDNAFIGRYSTSFNNFERLNHNVELFNEMLLDLLSDMTNVHIVATNANFDSRISYRSANYYPDKFDAAYVEWSATDIHPNERGSDYIADTIYQTYNNVVI